jgi:hypothetical protein
VSTATSAAARAWRGPSVPERAPVREVHGMWIEDRLTQELCFNLEER